MTWNTLRGWREEKTANAANKFGILDRGYQGLVTGNLSWDLIVSIVLRDKHGTNIFNVHLTDPFNINKVGEWLVEKVPSCRSRFYVLATKVRTGSNFPHVRKRKELRLAIDVWSSKCFKRFCNCSSTLVSPEISWSGTPTDRQPTRTTNKTSIEDV